jgi:hypothetical protein
MNFSAFQLFGAVAGAFFCYSAYIQYRKKVLETGEFAAWLLIWGGLAALSVISAFFFPLTTTLFLSYNLLDAALVLSITTLTAISFYLYKRSKVQEQKLKKIIKKLALEEAD